MRISDSQEQEEKLFPPPTVKTTEQDTFDYQLEDGGEIFIITDEFNQQRILRPRRFKRFSW